ncbi:MAG: hypothetical protein QN147_07260 [Armatimonadota bacterium]|nr:hypothetical protein [Armatimonadota bacterium]MDR7511805.1 hypothetical protein [Armatimonadota bacterium]
MTALPPLRVLTQDLPRPRIADPGRAARDALTMLDLGARVRGRRVALTAGSRGIRDIVPVLRAAVAHLRELGAEPVVVAAMGSHGGATAEGQGRVLAYLGLNAEALGAPVSTAMETVVVGHTAEGLAVHCDRVAAACDGVLVVNRIKPHTAFDEPFGSGLLKMLAVGLGKAEGAALVHRQGATRLAAAITSIARVHLDRGAVVGGLAIVENAYDETAIIEAIPPARLLEREPALFQQARAMMPRLPVDELDVLVVDAIGKDYAGTGMDPHVIGRRRLRGLPEPAAPRITRIAALRLSAGSEGNAQGIGLADVTTQRLVDAMDRRTTYTNTMTTTFLERAFIPLVFDSDREAIAAALATSEAADPARARVARIANTLHLGRLLVSEAVADALVDRPGITVGPQVPWAFDRDGWLVDLV